MLTKRFPFAMRKTTLSLVVSLVFAQSALADNIPLSDAPLIKSNTEQFQKAPTALYLIADDSGSMTWNFAPDDVITLRNACWRHFSNDAIAKSGKAENFVEGFEDTTEALMDKCFPVLTALTKANAESDAQKVIEAQRVQLPPMAAAAFNKLAYNPEITYKPPYGLPNQTDYTKVGWPDTYNGFTRPEGVPITVNMKTWSDEAAATKGVRTYTETSQLPALLSRYMRDAPSAELNLLKKPMGPHYFITHVLWCKDLQKEGAPGYEEISFVGSASTGGDADANCRKYRDDTYQYPYYYGREASKDGRHPAFKLVVLNTDQVNDEMTNYANWYAYYSNRAAATKTIASRALANGDLNNQYPLILELWTTSVVKSKGSVTVNDAQLELDSWLEKDSDSGPYKRSNEIFKQLYAYNVTPDDGTDTENNNQPTPLRKAVNSVSALLLNGIKDKSRQKNTCQRNFNVLLTDALWNDQKKDIGIANLNEDRTTPAPATKRLLYPVVFYGAAVPTTPSQNWPRPIYEGPTAVYGTLADVAMKYWLFNKPSGLPGDYQMNVFTTETDPATWPHSSTIAFAYGAEGKWAKSSYGSEHNRVLDDALNQIKNDTANNWPAPQQNDVTTVDDLWHATVNSGGAFFNSIDPDKYISGLKNIIRDIRLGDDEESDLIRAGTGRINETDEYAYFPSFSGSWSGDIKKRKRNSPVQAVPVWSAANKLNTKLTPTGDSVPWMTARKVFTMKRDETGKSLGAIPFTYDGLSEAQRLMLSNDLDTTQKTDLGSDEDQQKAVIAYLRGDKSKENKSIFKARTGSLGDFVNATPAALGQPRQYYGEGANPGYGQYKNKHANRAVMIYAAGNDGMVHAFDDDGEESWAYMPSELLRPKDENGIINLTYPVRDDGDGFKHLFYVDASPRLMDVNVTGEEGGWATYLVGGLGKGGTSYYALDVTEASGSSVEADLAKQKLKWEFTHDNMGYTYGRPILAKTYGEGDGNKGGSFDKEKWVAILPSGLNNGNGPDSAKGTGNGKAALYFVDLASGDLIHIVETGEGLPSDPLGMAYIAGYVNTASDQRVTEVYGGDQKGNFWRFNLRSSNPDDWKAEKLAVFKSEKGIEQPVNVEPDFDVLCTSPHNSSPCYRWVFVGTGRMFHQKDIESGVGQTMYAMKDAIDNVPISAGLPITRADLKDIGGEVTPDYDASTIDGWLHELDEDSVGYKYQMITMPVSRSRQVAYVATRFADPPDGDPCKSGGYQSRLYVRNIVSGNNALRNPEPGKDYLQLPDGIREIFFNADHTGVSYTQDDSTQDIADIFPPDGVAGLVIQPNRLSIRYID
ncbi:MAG: hypothetical protein LBS40_08325 [Burkholderiales bacterium]|nr:hypothetical protein [Burkholderiales bacterium]